MKNKYNLVLTHSFPTNSRILSGLIKFLEEYFNVFFIDLPGFTPDNPPLPTISIPNYAEYLETKINKLKIDKYILGGLSFSNAVIAHVKIDDHCRAILAMEPYVSNNSLLIKRKTVFFSNLLLKSILATKTESLLWKKKIVQFFFKFKGHEEILDLILEDIDAKTFIHTINAIINYQQIKFLDKPHILIQNPNDPRVAYNYNLGQYKQHVNDLLIIDSSIDHFPKDLSPQYFKKHLPAESIEKIFAWLEKKY